jgi:phage terminase large subunit-like protein
MPHFRKDLADRAETFIETYLRHTMGQWAGKPLRLLPFQREYIRKLFGTVREDGETRQYRTSFFSVARKNGKSTLCSA